MSENWKIQVSPKLPDGTLVNLRAENAEEMDRLLRFVEVRAQDITTTAALLTGAHVAASAGLTTPQYQQSAPAPWDAPAPQGGSQGLYTCNHGERKHGKGNGAKGEWQAMFCPTDKGTPGQCDPQWLKKGDPGWRY